MRPVLRLAVLAVALALPAQAQLSGTYTVGGSSPDYATVTAAVADLTAQGVSGPTTFAIRNGTYTEQISLGSISGASASNRVTFRAATPLLKPTLQFDATTAANYVVELNGTDFVTFQNLQFVALMGPNVADDVVRIRLTATDLVFEGCRFESATGDLVGASTTLTEPNRLQVLNSTFEGGRYGVSGGALGENTEDLVIAGNTFTGQSDAAVRLQATDSAAVFDNVLSDDPSATSSYAAIDLDTNAYGVVLARNEITMSHGAAGIRTATTGTVEAANNTVSIGGSNAVAAVQALHANVDLLYNTLLVRSTAPSLAHVLRIEDAPAPTQTSRVQNSLLIHRNSGLAMSLELTTTLDAEDYNSFYSDGSVLIGRAGTGYSSLADYQAATGDGAHSSERNIDVVDAVGGNLRLENESVRDPYLTGAPVAEVTVDLDGTPRDATFPQMGAHETGGLGPIVGTFTVGGATPDYLDPHTAGKALTTFGVAGNATFDIRPGTYDGRVSLVNVAGTSLVAKIVLRAEDPGDQPVLRNSAATSAANAVVRINGTDWVTLRNLDLEAAAPAPVGRLLVLDGDAEHITLKGCTFTGHIAPGSSDGSLVWREELQRNDHLTIEDNTFFFGWGGVDAYHASGGSSLNALDLTVRSNVFESQEYDAIAVQSDGVVEGNTITKQTGTSAGSSYAAIRGAGGPGGDLRVLGNTLALAEWSGITALGGTSLVANNIVDLQDSSPAKHGINAGTASIIHNTVVVRGLGTALRLSNATSGSPTNNELYNNVLFMDGAGTVLEDPEGSDILASDHNLFYTTAGTLVVSEGVSYSTLAAWSAASGFDANSVVKSPFFVNSGTSPDLHLSGPSLTDTDLIGAPVGAPFGPFLEDIDGDARDAYNPKMGADEGTPLPPLDNADTGAGFYTVGGSAPDFPDPDAAISALFQRSMKGAVTLRVRAGTYPLRRILNPGIRVGPAASDPASSELTIRAANLNVPPVLESSGTTASSNWVLKLNGIDHVTLRALSFDAGGGGTYGRALVLGGSANGTDDLVVDGCTFTGAASGASSDGRALLFSDLDGHDRLTVTGSTFTNGWAGVWLDDLTITDDDSPGATFSDNTFAGQSGFGLAGNLDDVTVTGNTVSGSATSAVGIRMGRSEGYFITGNQIAQTGTLSLGIWLLGTDADGAGTALIANNFVRADRPLYIDAESIGARIIHNTLYASGSNARALVTTLGQDEIAELTNNILKSASSGSAIRLAELDDLVASNGNVLHTVVGPALVEVGATNYATLADWQAASGLDARSQSFNVSVQNAGAGDLHLAAVSDGDPRLAGLPGTGIDTDFDGEARQPDNPTIGADEATPLLPLAGDVYVGVTPPTFPTADYATLAEAAEAVGLLGVSAATTFRLYPDVGAFPVTLGAFDGASPTNRLTLIPFSPGSLYTYAPTDAASNGMIRLDGADYVTIRDLLLDVSGGTAPYGRAIVLQGGVDQFRLESAALTGRQDTADGAAGLLWSKQGVVNGLHVENVTFSGGSHGIVLAPSILDRSSDTHVVQTTFVDPYASAVDLQFHDGPTFEDVTVEASRPNTSGIVLRGGIGGSITRARIALTDASGLSSGAVEFVGQSGTASVPFAVTNSFLFGADRAVQAVNATHLRVAHNTMRTTDGTSLGGVYVTNGGSNHVLENNILAADGGAVVFERIGASPFASIAANDLTTTGSSFADWDGTDYADLAAFQAGTGLAASSFSLPVTFVDADAGDLHLAGASVGDDALGALPLADVPDDIDGDTRSATWAYLGADEGDTPLTAPPVLSYAVTGPAPLGAFAHGDVASVRWTTLASDIGPSDPVRVSIVCPGQAPYVRYASTDNDGLAGVLLPASLGTHGSATDQASGCTAEVALASDPTRAAVSAPFVVYDPADKIAAVSTRAVDRLTSINPARYGLGDIVSWFWDETSVASTVDLSVVCDGRAEYVRYTATANDGVATAKLPLVFGAFETCRVEVTSSADPDVFARSGPFEVLDAPLPTLDLVAPVRDEAIAMGQTYTVEWTSEAVPPETTVRLVLRDLTGGSPNRFVGATTNTGTFAWQVPSDLSATDEYRLAISARLADETVVVSSVNGLTFTAAAAVAQARSASAEAPPEVLTLDPVRPNPSRAQAVVRVGLPEAGAVSVEVYDVRGRRVLVSVDGSRPAGWHEVRLDAASLAPGVYVVRLRTGAEVLTRTLTVVR